MVLSTAGARCGLICIGLLHQADRPVGAACRRGLSAAARLEIRAEVVCIDAGGGGAAFRASGRGYRALVLSEDGSLPFAVALPFDLHTPIAVCLLGRGVAANPACGGLHTLRTESPALRFPPTNGMGTALTCSPF